MMVVKVLLTGCGGVNSNNNNNMIIFLSYSKPMRIIFLREWNNLN